MHTDPRSSYLESQVLTATPQKLRLMLIEAALGAARQALNCWQEERDTSANIALIRCREIVSELLAAIKPDQSELTRSVAGIYLFLFKSLAEAQLHRDPAKVDEAIHVLEIERDTWRLVCEQMPQAPAAEPSATDQGEISSAQAATILGTTTRGDSDFGGELYGGLSLDA